MQLESRLSLLSYLDEYKVFVVYMPVLGIIIVESKFISEVGFYLSKYLCAYLNIKLKN
jgi:hypothetical protein